MRSLSHPVDVLWQPNTLLSIFAAGGLLALTLALASGTGEARLIHFGLLSFAVQWVILCTLSLLFLLRKDLRQRSAREVIAFALLALLAVTLASTWLSWQTTGSLWGISESDWWRGGIRFFISIFSATLIGLLALRAQWESRQLALRLKQAEFDALRARVDPHFLFNTLNTATALVHVQPDQAERVLLDLSDLFRAALSGKGEHTLAREVALTERYLQIERLRLGERLRLAWDLPSPLPELPIPSLALQTLAENAVRHGIEQIPGGGVLAITGDTHDGGLRLRVRNPTPSQADADAAAAGHRVGIAATRARIEAAGDGRGKLHIRHAEGVFEAEIELPPPADASG
ncbi:sensor histidine kinase [Lysobacter pythonis]|uniref:Sensor histidine kinase n=1 Tax=Solilutibacter pythonis TaxID=2483112 RepID=A0A3M2I2S6_9GAMM|nr:histidine kinase [Lysobacter pythonis]RMH93532.1 sensor histidine kinase [Lysobacter pythonis]